MPPTKKINDPKPDKDLALVIGNTMRWGVIISLTLTFAGGVIFLFQQGNHIANFRDYTGDEHHSIAEILSQTFSGLLHFDGLSLITTGILLLFATPVVRVVLSLLGFIIEKDKLYIFITLIVLAVIALSISGGIAH